MKGMLKGVAALALATALFASSAEAQGVRFGVAANGLFVIDPGSSTDFGATVMGEFGGGADSPIGFRADISYIFDPEILIFRGNVIYTFATAETSKFHPYLLGTGGYLTDTGFDNGEFAAGAGVGFNVMLEDSNITPFGEASFLYQFSDISVKYVDARLGVKIGSSR